MNYVPKH